MTGFCVSMCDSAGRENCMWWHMAAAGSLHLPDQAIMIKVPWWKSFQSFMSMQNTQRLKTTVLQLRTGCCCDSWQTYQQRCRCVRGDWLHVMFFLRSSNTGLPRVGSVGRSWHFNLVFFLCLQNVSETHTYIINLIILSGSWKCGFFKKYLYI